MMKVRKMHSFKDKLLGLIGEDNQNFTPILIQTRFGIHTFGVRFPIDVLVLNANYEIMAIKENLQPNSFFFWYVKYGVVLELPKNSIQNLNLNIGDKIELQ